MQNNNENYSTIKGDHNIVLQGVSDSRITFSFNGETHSLSKDFHQFQKILQKLEVQTIQFGEQILQFQELTASNFQNQLQNLQHHYGSGDNIAGDKITYNYYGEAPRKIPRLLTLNIPTQAENIIGREVELQKTHAFLQEHKPTALVNGMGGIGKTAVATKYIAQHLQDYQHFAWLTVQSSSQDNPIPNSIADTFTSNLPLLDSLGITTEINELLKAKAPKQAFQLVFKRLNDLDKTLLVIDNANQLQDLLQHRQLFERSCHILITSRTQPDNWQTVQIGKLPLQQAIDLFRQHHPKVNATDEQIKNLLTHLDRHTLLIELVAKSARKSAISFGELAKLIEDEYIRSKKLNRRGIDTGAGGDSVKNRPAKSKVADYIWFIFQNMTHLKPTAKELLRAFVLLPTATFFGEEFLESFFEVMELQSEEVYDDLEGLVERGWLEKKDFSETTTKEEETAKEGIQYKVHPLIAEVGVEKLEVEVEFAAKYIQAIGSAINYDNLNPEHQLIEKNKYKYLAERLSDLFFHENHAALSYLLDRMGYLEENYGQYQTAATFKERALDIALSLNDHPRVAVSQSNLANVYLNLGRYEEAASLLEIALASAIKNFGKDHPRVAVSQSNLANVYRNLGRYEEAASLLEIALASAIKNFGKDHPTVAVSQSNLANVYGDLGRYEEAASLLEIALASAIKNFGKDHPTVAVSQSNLANVYLNLGRYEEAASLLEIALSSDLKNFGKDHPEVSKKQSNLATVYRNLGRYEEAASLLEIALSSDLKNFGKDHPEVAKKQSNLANVYLNLGRYEEAASLLEIALSSDLKNFGKDHPTVATRLNNLANVYMATKNYQQAKEAWLQALQVLKAHFGESHPYIDVTIKSLQMVEMFIQMQQMGLNPEDLMK